MARAHKVCIHAGCPEPASFRGRCTAHAREYEHARGLPAQRGYGTAYRKATAQAKQGVTHCPRCGSPFTPSNPATGGHRRSLREGGSLSEGIEAQCRRCNYGWRRTGL